MTEKPSMHLITPFKLTPNPHKILMIASGKGGVGKTWFSITLAQSLANKGKKILLFDGDLGLANVDIQLGLMPERDLGTVISGQASLKQAVLHYEPGNFDILPGRSGCNHMMQLSPERLWALLQSLKTLGDIYDHVILDVGAGIGDTIKSMAHLADQCLVIVTDEPTSLTDAYALIKVTHKHSPDLPIRIVINQAENYDGGVRVYETLQRVANSFLSYQPELLGVIHRDSRVKDTIRSQTPLLTRFQGAQAAVDVEKIAQTFL